jgi:alpha-D-ribose 1-methylphosphonate 5-triphosphate synthase subunit PhnH
MQALALEGGFADAPIDAAHAFRAVMTAMARPGEIRTVRGACRPRRCPSRRA